MARPSLVLIDALRETAQRLDAGADYAWTHMGRCNCGHLVQTVTRQSPAQIHRQMLQRPGDWAEQATEFSEHPTPYCAGSGFVMDHVIDVLLDLGLTTGDVADLERLRNEKIRARMVRKDRSRPISHRDRDDVVAYLRAWAELLEAQLEAAADSVRPVPDPKPLARAGRARGPVRVRY